MALETQQNKVILQGNASATVFPYSFIIPNADVVVATFTDTDGTQTVLAPAQYTITGLDDANGGTVTYPLVGSPMSVGQSLTIQRIVPYTQPTVLENQGGYYPDVVEGADDWIVMQTQQLAEQQDRIVQAPAVDPDTNNRMELPAWQDRANKVMGFDSSGNAQVTDPTSGSATSAGSVNFLQAGVGAVSRTVQSKERDIVSVKDFGAVGDGVTNDTAAIQAALDTVASPGGGVYFPNGTYKITSGLTLSKPMLLYGNGGGSIIAPNFGTGDAIAATVGGFDTGLVVRGLTFKASATRTANYYLNLISCSYCAVEDCTFVSGFHGLGLTGGGAVGIHVDNCRFQSHTGNNIDVIAQTLTQGCVDVVLRDILIAGASSIAQSVAGVNITCAGDITLDHVSTIYAGTGLNAVAPNGSVIQALSMNDCLFDSGSGHGIQVTGTGTGVVRLVNAQNIWCCSNASDGLAIGAGNGTITESNWNNVIASANTGTGILLGANATNTTFIGGSVSQNTSHGISVAANTNQFKIIGMGIGAVGSFTGNGGWGVIVNGGTSNNYAITHNYFGGNTTGTLSDGGTGATKIIGPNMGTGSPTITGSFTVTLTGVTATTTGSATYSLSNNVATMDLPALTGTSNTTAATVTGIPSAIQPSSTKGFAVVTEDNGSIVVSQAVLTSGTLTLLKGTTPTSAFTNSGVKGLPNQSSYTYTLN